MTENNYIFNYKYDIPDDIIDSKLSSLDIKKSNTEITTARLQLNPTSINNSESINSNLRLSNFITNGKILDVDELNKFLSVCLYREDLIEVINNFDLFDSKSKIIALSNPLCYYELIKEVAENKMNNFDSLTVSLAKNILKVREKNERI